MHLLLTIFNAHDWTMCYVTTFSAEIFSLLNSIIYFHKAIQELQRAHDGLSFAAFLYSIIGAVGTMLVAIFLSTAERWKPFFHRYVRMAFAEYAAAISIIIFIGLPHLGELKALDRETLHVSTAFRPTSPDRVVFFVRFWQLDLKWIFAALVPGLLITILFFFDHEVSSIICTVERFGTKKPGGFAWDIMLLGFTTAMCGILGIPPANGLLPQAPLHSESLLHNEKEETRSSGGNEDEPEVRVVRRVYEQRWSAFLHAGAILIFASPPFQHILGLTPTSVLAGLFMYMGEQSLSTKYVFKIGGPFARLTVLSPVLYRLLHILTPVSELPPLPRKIGSYRAIHGYTMVQIIITILIFVITLTKGAPAFPVVIIALVPVRLLLMNKIWKRDTLRYVDAWACKEGTPEDDEDRAAELEKRARPEEGLMAPLER